MKPFYTQLSEWNMRISWTFVKIGSAFIDYTYRIRPEDVRAYAEARLETNPECKACLSLLLADTDAEVLRIVLDLSEQERSSEAFSFETEHRKWIAYALYQAIYDFPEKPSLNDMFALQDLWCYFGFPAHYPWNPRTSEYIKVSDVHAMLETHRSWLKTEIEALTSCSRLYTGRNPNDVRLDGECISPVDG